VAGRRDTARRACRGRTRRDQGSRAVETIERVGKSLSGMILKMASTKRPQAPTTAVDTTTNSPSTR
jgi:hypothetical protein